MKNCYLCGNVLDVNNRTKEHIIPNALGGKLTSFEIICKECNSKSGEGMDVNFINSIQKINLMTLLNIERDRGSNPLIEGKDNDYLYNIEYNPKNQRMEAKRRESKPVDKTEDGIIVKENVTQRQAKSVLEKLKKEYPEIDVEKEFNKINWTTPHQRDDLKIDFELELPNDMRGLVKIAVNYFLHKGGESSHTREPIEFIITEGSKQHIAFLIAGKDIYSEGEISHTLFLYGNPDDNFLYCYINLFSVYSYIILLDLEYKGESIKEQYIFDLKEQKEIHGRNLKCVFTQKELCNHIDSYSIEDIFNIMEQKLKNIVNYYYPDFNWHNSN